MNNLKLILLFFPIVLTSSAQVNCDSIAIIKIVNAQLKVADKYFERSYVISSTSIPFDTAIAECKPDSIYALYTCGRFLNWDHFNLQSEYGRVETSSDSSAEYSLFIATPLFNNEMNLCRLYVSSHFSEFGGSGFYYYYEKKGQKWKFVKHKMIWVS